MYKNEVDSVWALMLPKIRIVLKKALNKKMFEIEFRTKKFASAYVCLPPEGGRGLERFPSLKIIPYYFSKVGIFRAP